jgi:hypothetical protein
MPLPSGTWKANVNGTEADLIIEAPNQQGVFVGQFFGAPFSGFWDEFSQTIAFTLTVIFENNRTPIIAWFNGHLFRSPPNPEPGRDVVVSLTGSLQVSAGNLAAGAFPAIGTSRRNVFGWFAHIPEIQ